MIDRDVLIKALPYIDQWIDFQQRSRRLPGVSIAVGFRGEVVLSKSYGLADSEKQIPLTTNHIFRIASHSKVFTAVAIMQLVERNLIRLDDQVGKFLSWMPNERGQVGQVTVRQLLNHSSGIVRDGYGEDFWQYEQEFPTNEELQDAIKENPLVLAPNERLKYSNVGYGLLGLLIESVSGTPYNQYVVENIIEPLKLSNTGPELNEHALSRLVTGYTSEHYGLERTSLPHIATGALAAATGFYSTAEDLCRFATAHFLGNEELLTDESKREMQHSQWPIDYTDDSYGLGMVVVEADQKRYVGHRGAFPGYKTATYLDPKEQLVVVVLLNSMDELSGSLNKGILRIINRASKAGLGSPESNDLDKYVGRYFSLWGVIDITRFGDELVGLYLRNDDPFSEVAKLRKDSSDENSLLIVDETGYGNPGERITFVRDSNGKITKIYWGGWSMHPLEEFNGPVMEKIRNIG